MIDPGEPRLDSRDVIDRINSLEADYDFLDAEQIDELRSLHQLEEQAEFIEDWEHGIQLIREDHFTEYAKELAEDCGMLENAESWPCYCIDWEWAARELSSDYASINWAGYSYYAR